jgi:hypothetical protein
MENFGLLFDPSWYLAQNSDVAAAGAEPLTHYIEYGAAEGRDPNPLFDTRWYLAQNSAVAAAGLNPVAHYLASGAAEGRDPHPLFDTDWYLAQNSDVFTAGVNPLAHFLERGAREGRAPNPSFDLDWSRPEYAAPQILLPDPAQVSRPKSPLVSVVVPVFNNAPYLWDCLSSILLQSLDDIEIICVEDGSTDESPAILAEAARRDPRMFVVRNIVNSGAAASRNAGIHLARGKFLQFTDADDVLPRDALRTLYDLAMADQVPLVRGSLNLFRGDPAAGGWDAGSEYRGRIADSHSVRIADEPNLWLPWWHTTYLIDLSFLREVRGSYPNLSEGEDPVFMASLLSEAERVSTTSQITYLARSPEAPRRTRLKHAIDFVRHAAMVRRIYLDHCPQRWRDGYRPFLLSKADECFLRPHLMSGVEQHVIRLAMMRAGIGAYLPLAARSPGWGRDSTGAERPGFCWEERVPSPAGRNSDVVPSGAARTLLNAKEFLLNDFEGRIHLVNQASNARLWSSQLAPIWRDIIRQLESGGDHYGAVARKLTRELLVLAPDSTAAEEAYRNWMKDDGLRGSIPDPAIVYLIVSCEKYKQRALPLYDKIVSHLNPAFIVLGDEKIDEAVFSGQFLTVPAPDNYESLPRKVLEALVAVRRECGKVGILKIDDDAQFHAEPDRAKIRELVSCSDYVGVWGVGDPDMDRCWKVGRCEYLKDEPYSKRFRGSWAAGPLYYLGPNAVELLVRDYTSFPGEFAGEIFEDKVVGDILRAHGITLSEARLSEIFGIDLLVGGYPPELAPLTIDWQGVAPMSRLDLNSARRSAAEELLVGVKA